MVKVKANSAFMHDAHNVDQGDEIEVSEALAQELEGVGLVHVVSAEEKSAATPENKMAAAPKNKAKSK